MTPVIEASFNLFGVLKRNGKWFIARCPALHIATQGHNQAEAKKNLVEACDLFLRSCVERGTLDQALRELGFVAVRGRRRSLPRKAFRLDIPIPFGLERNASWRA